MYISLFFFGGSAGGAGESAGERIRNRMFMNKHMCASYSTKTLLKNFKQERGSIVFRRWEKCVIFLFV